MKKILFILLLFLSLLTVASFASETVESPDSCNYCGMDRTQFAHSRMLVEYDDNTSTGTCSLHCMAVELANNIDKSPAAIKVGDFNSKKLIDAESAVWVIGGDKQGVMTARAKWAFANKSEAEAFISSNKGSLGTFDDAIKASYEDMYKDTKMIRDKRKQKKMKMGNSAPMHGHN
ncbi:MAG: NosL family protein [Deltaproteobacteria bacterium HGW-Deltaproteobacteria-4]|nr:MAG: NosL family protein [Deltaproteobacteria bacterium HGW-Deltaproteobacteria-4]